jgi:phosphoribosylanthranilate isomerase
MLQTEISLRNVQNLSAARYAASMSFSMISFDLSGQNEQSISLQKAKEIASWVSGPRIIGFFQECVLSVIRDAHAFIGLDAVELAWPFDLQKVQELELPVIPVLTVSQLKSFIEAKPSFDMIIVTDNRNWEILQTMRSDITLINEIQVRYPMIFECPFTAADVRGILETIHPMGIAITPRAEEKTGIGDFENLDLIVEILEAE